MKPTVTYEEILTTNSKKQTVFVDVRSPAEYHHATIPGAINIPVLDDATREKIGVLYVNGEIEAAKKLGVEWGASKLPTMYTAYQNLLNKYDEIILFCSRGGMRSNTIFSLLKALGMPVSRIKGGYKAYRNYVVRHLDEQLTQVKFITLYGLSGSGKTEILKKLADQGQEVLDLEACANHRGSLLGSVGLSAPNSQKTFESLLFDISRNWKPEQVVFTEGESRRIGKVVMPSSLYTAIQEGQKILIQAELDVRISQIHHDYFKNTSQLELLTALAGLKKVMNEARVEELKRLLLAGQEEAVIEQLLTSYYDPRYKHYRHQYKQVFTNCSAVETAEEIVEWLKSNQQKREPIHFY